MTKVQPNGSSTTGMRWRIALRSVDAGDPVTRNRAGALRTQPLQRGTRVHHPLPCRGAVAALAVVLSSTLLLAGCAAYQPQGNQDHRLGDADLGDLHVRAVRLVKAVDDRAVAVVATFINYAEPDVLTAVTIRQDNATGRARSGARFRAEPNLSIGTYHVVRVGGPGHPRIHIPDPRRRLRAGFLATVTLSFELAGRAKVDVIIDDPEDYLAPYAPPSTTDRRCGPRR
jgi:hypothetical protein